MHCRSYLSCHRLQKSIERFTNTKLADMHLIYGLAEGNAREAKRLYRERYPQRDTPDRRMFAILPHNLCEYGSLPSNRLSDGGSQIPTSHGVQLIFLEKIHEDEKPWQRSFSFLRRGSSRYKKKHSGNNQQQGMELLGIDNSSRRPSAISLRGSPNRANDGDHLRPNGFGHRRSRSRSPGRGRSPTPTRLRGRSPTPIGRSPSPRRGGHDIGFSDAVSDVVDLVKYESTRRSRGKVRGDEYSVHPHDSPTRGRSPNQWTNKSSWQPGSPPRWSRNNSPEYHSSCLDRRSRSPSPKPTPTLSDYHYRMGVTQQEHRSRSPSPSSAHSLPPQRRPGGRRLPPPRTSPPACDSTCILWRGSTSHRRFTLQCPSIVGC
ncbi:hypothetical protein TNCV_476881 [Trichonephila clavipes]|nr:hypothetical protein TNCV_476881 [Trichonephila clavipes]